MFIPTEEDSFSCISFWEFYVPFDYMGKGRMGVKPRHHGLAYLGNILM